MLENRVLLGQLSLSVTHFSSEIGNFLLSEGNRLFQVLFSLGLVGSHLLEVLDFDASVRQLLLKSL